MLDPVFVREHLDIVRTALRNRGIDSGQTLEEIVTLESVRRRVIPELETLKREQNAAAEEVGLAKRQGRDTTELQEANRARSQQIKQLDLQLDAVEYQRTQALLTLPN